MMRMFSDEHAAESFARFRDERYFSVFCDGAIIKRARSRERVVDSR